MRWLVEEWCRRAACGGSVLPVRGWTALPGGCGDNDGGGDGHCSKGGTITQLNSVSGKPKIEEERPDTVTNLETGTSLELCLHPELFFKVSRGINVFILFCLLGRKGFKDFKFSFSFA